MKAAASVPAKVCTLGLWHLGCVASACLAEMGYTVTGYDPDADRGQNLMKGAPPLYEPGLAELIDAGLNSGRLAFTDDLAQAVAGAHFVLFTFDTPLDDRDQADPSGILATAAQVGESLEDGATVIVMSQVPVGELVWISNGPSSGPIRGDGSAWSTARRTSSWGRPSTASAIRPWLSWVPTTRALWAPPRRSSARCWPPSCAWTCARRRC